MEDKPKLRPVELVPVKSGRETMICIRDATGLSDRVVTASVSVVGVLRMLDGKHTVLDMQAVLTRERGELVMSDEIKKMLDVLDEAFLLEGERFEVYHRRLHEEFAKAPVRKATSAGSGYPDEADKLRAFLDEILAEAEGDPPEKMRGVIAPHIDHHRGRKCYAEAFAALGRVEPSELYVILGTSHADTAERFALTRKDFETPLGKVATDTDAVDGILKRSSRDLLVDEFVHRGEHSIELELVFLQRLCEKAGHGFRILPILCGSFTDAMVEDKTPGDLPGVPEVIDALKELVRRDGVTLVVGADLSHVGPRFGVGRRVTRRTLDDLERVDRETLAFVENGDADGFCQFVARDENARNICSVAPIYVALKTLEPTDVKLLGYEQWTDDDGTSCVTFASAAIS